MNPPRSEASSRQQEAVKKPTRASEYVKALHQIFRAYEKDVKPDMFVRILYASAFGIFRVKALQSLDAYNLEVCVYLNDDNDKTANIVAPVEQCSIQFLEAARTPATEANEKERPFIGFTVKKEIFL